MSDQTATLALAIRIAQMLEGHNPPTPEPQTDTPFRERKVIVRGDRSGVFYGTIVAEDGRTVELVDVRRIFYWEGAASTVELAERGVSRPEACKFTGSASRVRVLDAIEVHDCSVEAVASLDAVAVWSEFS